MLYFTAILAIAKVSKGLSPARSKDDLCLKLAILVISVPNNSSKDVIRHYTQFNQVAGPQIILLIFSGCLADTSFRHNNVDG